MEVQVHEYAWMWQRLGLSLAECRVYAFIYGLTKSKKYNGYEGSKRQLATMLGLDVSGTRKILDKLVETNLITCVDGKWKSVDSVLISVDSVPTNVDSVLSPHTPLYNNINNNQLSSFAHKSREEDEEEGENFMDNYTDNFLTFWKLFNPAPEFANRKIATAKIFDESTSAKQIALIRSLPFRVEDHLDLEVRTAGTAGSVVPTRPKGVGLNPYFYVNNFPEPTPTNYNGKPQIDQLLKEHKVKSACYNGKWGMYTIEDIQLFNLQTSQ